MNFNKSKLYFILYEMERLLFGKKYIAIIDITSKCNLKCKHCYNRNNHIADDETSLADWQKRFEKYRKAGIRFLIVMGGEPSLKYDVLRIADKYFDFIDVVTNGQIKIPTEFNHRIFLSLEGLKEEHNAICGEGAFEGAVKNYRGDKRAIIFLTIFKLNYRGPKWLKNFLDFARNMDVKGLRFTNYLPLIREDNSLLLNFEQKKEIRRIFLEELKRKDSVLLMTKNMINILTQPNVVQNKCVCQERGIFLDEKGKIKKCVNNLCDCSRCCIYQRCEPPLYQFPEWLYDKWVRYKSL